MNPQDHTRFIVSWLGIIVLSCLGAGTYLFVCGYQSGELLIGIAGAGAGSLGTMVAMRRNSQPGVNDPATVQTTTTETKA
jgi:hypothetical protein